MDMGAPPSEEAISSSQAELEQLLAGPSGPASGGITLAVAIVVAEGAGVTSEELPVVVLIGADEGVSVAAEAPTAGFPLGTTSDFAPGPSVGAQGVVLVEDSPPTAGEGPASPSMAAGGSWSGANPEVDAHLGGPSVAPSEPPGGLPLPFPGAPGTSRGELCLRTPTPTLWDEDAESSAHQLLEKGLRLTERVYRKMILSATRVNF